MTVSKRTFVPEDLYRLIQVGDPQIHPDGNAVVFVRAHVEGDKKQLCSHLWIAPLNSDGGHTLAQAKPYTRGTRQDARPRWSPDGRRLAFVRQTGEGPEADRQIWIMDRDGGEAWPLTTMRHGTAHFVWSPDSRRIAFNSPLGDTESDDDARTPKTDTDRQQEKQQSLDEARHVTRFHYKSDHAGLLPPRRAHVWVVDVPDEPPSPASDSELPIPHRITRSPFDHSLLDWSPDGRFLAVGASYEDERDPTNDIWIFPVPASPSTGDEADSAEPTKLTDGDGVFYDARWSPDGRRLAVVGHKREHRASTRNRLWLFPAPGAKGKGVCVTDDWDRGLGGTVNSDFRPGMAGSGMTWGSDGSVYFVADDRGRTKLYRIDPETLERSEDSSASAGKAKIGPPQIVAGGPMEVYGFSLSADGSRAAIAVADMFNPEDIYVLDAEGNPGPADTPSPTTGAEDIGPEPGFQSDTGWTSRRLTAVNADLLAHIELPTVEEIAFPSADGLPIHGWIMRPVPSTIESFDGDEGVPPASRHKAPAVLQIHGGPQTCWGHSFSLEMHLQAAMGFAVIFANPRGSTSYGQAFVNGVLDDYGGRDYEDLMAAVDYAIGLGGIDEHRLAVTGGSYGGFMTNWIVTQTNRFRAGISHRSISNWISFWGVSDIGPRFMDGQFGAPSLWDGFDGMWERSPLKHARAVETPLLLCHSEHDLRCPMEQAEQFYLALKWEGKTVELLRHPRSNHDLTRTGPPTLRVDRFEHIARFLREHVLTESEAGGD